MDVQILLNDVDISDYVVSYRRDEHICTAVGTLELVLSANYDSTIEPWDTIKILEDGELMKTFHINEESTSAPEYTRVINAQDESKKLIDIFINELYTINYPSNTLYWIEKFLVDSGITYSVEAGTTGVLLSNPTSVGRQSTYEQLMQLLQMSGLYIKFDQDNAATIGKLSKNLSDIDATVYDTDILHIAIKKDDRMLRNRAVVWGSGNPTTKTWVFADVSVNTPWNYDLNDKRAVVLSQPNVPNNYTAYSLANILLNEFARITCIKEVEVTGTRGITLGDVIYVDSQVYSGSGIVTSISVEMSEKELKTILFLDERCPRLFGYFNFGGYVYIGTQGDGVWRKQLELDQDQTWRNYSTGLGDLNIVDLYKNNGVLSCVDVLGDAYYRKEIESSWHEIDIQDQITISGAEEIVVSGIYAHAITQDRITNNIRIAVDNKETHSATVSGLDGSYGWILDVSAVNGSVLDSYPINISGDYNLYVVDLENDGINDYVSVVIPSGVSLLSGNDLGYDYGYSVGASNFPEPYGEYTPHSKVHLFSNKEYQTNYIDFSAFRGYSIYDNESIEEHEVLRDIVVSTRLRYQVINASSTGYYLIHSTTILDSPVPTILMRKKISSSVYEFYGITTVNKELFLDTWDTDASTVTRTSFTQPTVDPSIESGIGEWSSSAAINGVLYLVWYIHGNHHHSADVYKIEGGELIRVENFHSYTGRFRFNYLGELVQESVTNQQTPVIVPLGSSYTVHCAFSYLFYYKMSYTVEDSIWERGLFTSTKDGAVLRKSWEVEAPLFPDTLYSNSDYSPTTDGYAYSRVQFIIQEVDRSGNVIENPIFWTPDSYTVYGEGDMPPVNGYYPLGYTSVLTGPNYYTIIPFRGTTGNICAARIENEDTGEVRFYYLPAETMQLGNELVLDADYTIVGAFPQADTIDENIYWEVHKTSDNGYKLLTIYPGEQAIQSEFIQQTKNLYFDLGSSGISSAINCGNVFIVEGDSYCYMINYEQVDYSYEGGSLSRICGKVLRRDGTEFTEISVDTKEQYLELSDSYPLVIMCSGNDSFTLYDNITGSSYIDNEVIPEFVPNGFKYSNISISGAAFEKELLNGYDDVLSMIDITDISEELISDTKVVVSGIISSIETTNHKLDFQYNFVATESPVSFYQKQETSEYGFNELNDSLPNSRVNIIRVDDRL